MDHKEFSKKGGVSKTEAKKAAARINGKKKYQTTVPFRVYGANNETIKDGVLIFNKKVPEGEESISLMMDALADVIDDEFGAEYFDDEVCGVEFSGHAIKER